MTLAVKADLANRRSTHERLALALERLDDDEVLTLVGKRAENGFWGTHQTVEVAGNKTFVKRIPVTRLERDNMFSTRNLYGLPLYYNYGVGSVGLGVWRELAMHLKTTRWVLDGVATSFPLMHHRRVVPRVPAVLDSKTLADYTSHWNDSTAVGRYAEERAGASDELLVFLEYVPYDMGAWLAAHQQATPDVVRDMCDTISFLRGNGIVHFDAHLDNFITDGSGAMLTDFGLVLDDDFQLTDEERDFRRRHDCYDYGVALWSLGKVVWSVYASMPEPERIALRAYLGVDSKDSPDVVQGVVRRIEDVVSTGAMQLDPTFVAAMVRYRDVMEYMSDFFQRLQLDGRMDATFDDSSVRRMLEVAGVL